jgi:hypothetical protein
MDSHFLLDTLAAHGVQYVLDSYGEPVFGPAVASEGVRVIPGSDKNNMNALAAALTQVGARLDPARPPGGEIQGKPLAGMLQGSWYLRFYTDAGKFELLHDYTHKVAGIMAPQLAPGEGVIAAVPAERAGKQKNADLLMMAGALPGNLLRRKKAQRAAREMGFPDASAMVLAATTQRIAVFQQDARSRLQAGASSGLLPQGAALPDTHIGDVAYERVAQVEAGKPEIVGAAIRRAGYVGFVFRDGNTHMLTSWSGGGPLFASSVNVLAGRVGP